jgi:hypothetical protein
MCAAIPPRYYPSCASRLLLHLIHHCSHCIMAVSALLSCSAAVLGY